MSYKVLTDNVYWGNRHSVEELKDKIGSVLCVAHNPEFSPGGGSSYNPLILHGDTPYFRMGLHDDQDMTSRYFLDLTALIRICLEHTPVLIHCYAGSHRSSVTAAWAATLDALKHGKQPCPELFQEMWSKVKMQQKVSVRQFSKDLQRYAVGYLVGLQAGI